MLEARKLTFSYDGTTKVLDSLDFRVKKGEIIVITGSTGSGKSTLAKCLAGFIPRSIPGDFSGSVIVDDIDTAEFPVAEVARQIALVQQDSESQICTLQVADEVAFGPENYGTDPETIASLVDSSLNAVGSSHLHSRATFELSGGEKQRLIIASMIACQPNYLILDEPSSSLDPIGVLQLRNILRDLKGQNIGILLIEHNLSTVQPVADRILLLSEGRLHPLEFEHQQPTEITPREPFTPSSTVLSTQNLSFSYEDRQVINSVSLSINKGEVIGLMGGNGSGKTTLLGLLGGLLLPESGNVYLGGSSLEKMSAKDIARATATVFQNPNHQIFEKTVWKEQNLTLYSLDLVSSEMLQQSETTLKRAKLVEMKKRNPFSLSHGQKRRLNVTSTTVHKPEILLFDEPFIGQDQEGRKFIIETVDETVKEGGAALIVTHDPVFVRNHCDRVMFMENGVILLDGASSIVLDRLESLGHQEYAELGVKP
ncbi:MAG: ABC transporter ATP-binding protein [Candidatus Thorarchaeota archaeon]|jgi:energy-coupling factor transport system ATP-binding protein